MDKSEEIYETVRKIDIALQGDDARGVKGIKHHMEKLSNDFSVHIQNDSQQFVDIAGQLSKIKTEQKNNYAFVKGAIFILGGLVAAVEVVKALNIF